MFRGGGSKSINKLYKYPMKTFWLSIVLLCTLVACKENSKIGNDSNEKPFDILSLPADWVKLTKTDSGMIIFNSCEGGNTIISLSKVKDTIGLLMHGTQEDYDFVVLRSVLMKNDTILVNLKWRGWDENQDIKFVWVDKAKQVAKWMTTYKEGSYVEYTCVTSDRQKDFKTVNQPCRECWGDECDEREPTQNKTDSVAPIKDSTVRDTVTSANNNE